MKVDLRKCVRNLHYLKIAMMKNKNSVLPTLWKRKERILMSKMTSGQLKIFSRNAFRRTHKLITTWGLRSIIGNTAVKLTMPKGSRFQLQIINIRQLGVIDQAAVLTQLAMRRILSQVHLLELHIRFQEESIVR